MMLQDLHVHTTYCDGRNTPEEMVLAAIEKGLTRLGFSGHSYQFFDEEPCMSKEGTRAYRRDITALKEKYRNKIEILCGIEQEYFSDISTEGYDYVIGSVHYLKIDGKYRCIDQTEEEFCQVADRWFGGDMVAMAQEYYRLVGDVVNKTGADIIGHFDLITKYNEGGRLFDESDPRYVAAWKQAADRLLATGKIFEINTGAISRGYRTEPYPALPILQYIRQQGGKVMLNGDTHSAQTLCYQFDQWADRVW